MNDSEYRQLFNALDQGACILEVLFDENGECRDYIHVEVNSAFEKQTGLVDGVGKRMRELYPDMEDHWPRIYGGVAKSGIPVKSESYFAGLDRWFRVYAIRLGQPGSRRVGVVFTDRTAEKRAELRAQLLEDVSRRLASAVNEYEIVGITTNAVGIFLKADRCYFVECLPTENVVVVSKNWLNHSATSLEGRFNLGDFGGIDWWRQYSAGDFVVQDVTIDPLTKEKSSNYVALGIRSYAVQPFRSDGQWTTVLAVTSQKPRSWSRFELELLADVVARTWPLVARARAEEALRASERALQADARRLEQSIKEIQLARRTAEASSKAKDDFLAALSHELRTPLTPVLLTVADLRVDERLPEDIRDQLTVVERNVALEARLIDDLLDLTRVSHGKLQLLVEPSDAHSLICQAIEIVQEDSKAKGITISRRFNSTRSEISVDPARFQQVLWNLLRNSVKFTPKGGQIIITTSDSARGEGDQWLTIAVSDSGIGIEPELLQSVFRPFDQGAIRGAHRFGGLGLGLAIARAVVELHGGSIKADSPGVDQGSTFTVEFPGATTPRAGVITTATGDGSVPKSSRPATRSLRLLLVEDHENTMRTLLNLLQRDGHSVVSAGSMQEAIAAADPRFDLVISDLGLPDGSGIELMEKLRSVHGLRGLALSGYGMEEDLVRSREAGFIGHLIKPVAFDQLRRAIQKITGQNY